MAATELVDDEFGTIIIRFYTGSTSIRFRVNQRGQLTLSAPRRTPKFLLRRVIDTNRTTIRSMHQRERADIQYVDSRKIGKSHQLAIVTSGVGSTPRVKVTQRTIVTTVSSNDELRLPTTQRLIQTEVIKALRKEARSYLPRRLSFLATKHQFSYKSTRLTHAGTRWGSCSSSGTISMNIALMKLDYDLIDYVLLHELCHTKEMNHSTMFWSYVELVDPDYRNHKLALKQHSPAL